MSIFCQIETGKGIAGLKNAAGGAHALIVANPYKSLLLLRETKKRAQRFKLAPVFTAVGRNDV